MRSRHLRRWAVYAGIYLLLCLVAGIMVADGALHPGRRPLTNEDIANFRHSVRALNVEMQDVSIIAKDNVVLRGWLLSPQQPNGDAVVLLHGLSDNRLGMAGYAQLLLSHGFTVLMPDARSHGESGGAIATYGLLERDDIGQWVKFLRSKGHSGCVYGLGESMGAAELLQSLEAGADFCGVVAESPFSTFREIGYDRMGQTFHLGPWVGRTIFRPLVDVAFLRARWKYGFEMERVSPEDAVAHSRVPVLLIHGVIDSNIPVRHSEQIHLRNPQTVLWEVPHADHCGAIAVAPEEFESKVLGWFAHSSAAVQAGTGVSR